MRVLIGDALEQLRTLPDASVQCVVTSPPYFGLRDYGVGGQIGLESAPAEYVAKLVAVFHEVMRVLRNDGTAWINLGDSFSRGERTKYAKDSERGNGSKHDTVTEASGYGGGILADRPEKNLLGIPWRVAFALQDDGWILRSDIIWAKPNCMPSSVKDRPTSSHEHVFLLSKNPHYYYDAEAIAEPAGSDNGSYFDRGKTALHPNQGQDRRDKQRLVGKRQYVGFNERWDTQTEAPTLRNKRDVWTVSTSGYPEAHFATFPPALIEPMIVAGCPEGGAVLDPFAGSGTTLAVANRLGRHAIGIELNPEYLPLIEKRCAQATWVLLGSESGVQKGVTVL